MLKTIFITIVSILAFGMLRMPWERHVMMEEKKADLLIAPPSPDSPDSLEQQLSLVSLGGLRSLVAAFLSVEAFDYFRTKDWHNLERRYRQIVSLAPHSTYYWDTGAWHLAYNAASSIKEDKALTSAERIQGYKDYIRRGKSFMKQGIDANPNDWKLRSQLANLLSDPLRYPDYTEAADAYRDSRLLGAPDITARQEFYTRARIPGQARSAWILGKELFRNPDNRQPSLVSTLFALENRLNLPEKERIPFHELFPTDALAIRYLRLQMGNSLGYPVDGVRARLDKLLLSSQSKDKQ